MSEYADPDKNESSLKDPSTDDNYHDPSRLEYHQTGDSLKVSAQSGGKQTHLKADTCHRFQIFL